MSSATGKVDTVTDRRVLPVREGAVHPVHAGRRVVVTGAARGLGRAVAARLVAEGARVWLVDVLADPLLATAAELGAAGHTVADLGDDGAVEAAVDAADTALGGLDGLVNAAGIAPHHDVLAIPRAEWRRIFDVNLFASYAAAAALARTLIRDGRPGAVVNIASEAGKVGHVDSLAYSASKAGVISLTRTLSAALAPHDINVNAVCPGGMPTTMLRDVARVYADKLGRTADDVLAEMVAPQLQRHTLPEEVAPVVSFLLSEAASMIRGQAVNADAGGTPY